MPRRLPSAREIGLAESDADVLDGVVLIDVEIAVRVDAQIERAVAREQLEHVIEESDAGRDVVPASAVEFDPHPDLRLRRPSVDQGAAHSTSSSTSMQRVV